MPHTANPTKIVARPQSLAYKGYRSSAGRSSLVHMWLFMGLMQVVVHPGNLDDPDKHSAPTLEPLFTSVLLPAIPSVSMWHKFVLVLWLLFHLCFPGTPPKGPRIA
eukprot:4097858-Amphidinium_carterae.1